MGALDTTFVPYASAQGVSLVGKAKIVMPQYRVRGVCRIECAAPGELVIDFRHSSLFGAYREDAAIVVREGGIAILDRERDRFFEGDSATAIIGSLLGMKVFPDDLLYALLFESPRCSEIAGLETGGGGGQWFIRGLWRGRMVELEGKDRSRPERFRICSGDASTCYIISYQYGHSGAYPRRIDLVREGHGDERIVLEIIEEGPVASGGGAIE